jgi:hypothetical protein
MLLQTNSYIVPKDKRTEHARLVARFRQVLARLGCDHFEAYEQVGANWSGETTGRFVQIMRFRDRKHQQAVQAAERSDPAAQALIKDFCQLINFPYQQQQGLFAVGFYTSLLPGTAGQRVPPPPMQAALADSSASSPAGSGASGNNGQSDASDSPANPTLTAPTPCAPDSVAAVERPFAAESDQTDPAHDPIEDSDEADHIRPKAD